MRSPGSTHRSWILGWTTGWTVAALLLVACVPAPRALPPAPGPQGVQLTFEPLVTAGEAPADEPPGNEPALVEVVHHRERALPPGSLRLADLRLLDEPPRAIGDYVTRSSPRCQRNEELLVYTEISGLLPREVSGGRLRYALRAGIQLFDRQGRAVDYRRLSPSSGDAFETAQPLERHFLWKAYRVPLRVPNGACELVLTVTDVNSGEQAAARLPLEIAP